MQTIERYNLREQAVKLRLHIEQAIKFTDTTPSTHRKSQELLGEIANSKFGGRKCILYDKLGTSHTTKQTRYQSLVGLGQRIWQPA